MSARHVEALALLDAGKSYSEAAAILGVSRNVIAGISHRSSEKYRLRVRNGPGRARGERVASAKLTETVVREMRSRRLCGWTFKEIAYEAGVTTAAAWHAVQGRTWKHVR